MESEVVKTSEKAESELVLGFELERIIHRCIIHVLYRIIPSVPRRGRIVRIELRIEVKRVGGYSGTDCYPHVQT